MTIGPPRFRRRCRSPSPGAALAFGCTRAGAIACLETVSVSRQMDNVVLVGRGRKSFIYFFFFLFEVRKLLRKGERKKLGK